MKKITRRIKVTNVKFSVLNLSGEDTYKPYPGERMLVGEYDRESAESKLRVDISPFLTVESVEVVEKKYSMAVEKFVEYAVSEDSTQ